MQKRLLVALYVHLALSLFKNARSLSEDLSSKCAIRFREPELRQLCPFYHNPVKKIPNRFCSHVGEMYLTGTSCGVAKVDPLRLFEFLQGKTLYFLGDSLSQQFAQATRCTLFKVQGLQSKLARMFPPFNAIAKHSCATFRARNGKQARVCNIKMTQHYSSSRWRCGNAFRCMRNRLEHDDILVANFGTWYSKQEDSKSLKSDFLSFRQDSKGLRGVRIIWWETPAQHFDTRTGLFDRTVTLETRCVDFNRSDAGALTEARWRIDSLLQLQRFTPLSTFESSLRADASAHIGSIGGSKPDCTHWCVPGLPSIWVQFLYEELTNHNRHARGKSLPLAFNQSY
mmetsp:Transcript_32958/g.52795  ORF Transcript_32958/g.52795 Transcript_32958/m.52795 type:complete len:341 (+) Transcript_32958:1160-2182(+)